MCLNIRLKKVRKDKKVSQRKLAQSSGVSFTYIQQLEKGEKKNPSIDIIKKLAFALNVSINELLADNSRPIEDIINDISTNYSLSQLEEISNLNIDRIGFIFDSYRQKDTSIDIRKLGTALNLSDKQILDWVLFNEKKPLVIENIKELQLSYWYNCFFNFPFKNVNGIELSKLSLSTIKEIVFALNDTFENKLSELSKPVTKKHTPKIK